jgi:hypothetical protein
MRLQFAPEKQAPHGFARTGLVVFLLIAAFAFELEAED